MYQLVLFLVQRGSLSPFTEQIASADSVDKDAIIPVPPSCIIEAGIFEKEFFYVAIERNQSAKLPPARSAQLDRSSIVLIYQVQAYEAVARRSSMRPARQGSRRDKIGLIILPRTRRRLAP